MNNPIIQNQLCETRFIYRTTGAVSSIVTAMAVGTAFGGPFGTASGLVVGIVFAVGDIYWDEITNFVDELNQGIEDLTCELTTALLLGLGLLFTFPLTTMATAIVFKGLGQEADHIPTAEFQP